ncbi:hypothetical protein F4604DRAFT_1735563 [Suillus subluteus]|nr:hypothetical protein F4604DRAFT_1735563 [Suillus subluteus]
MPVGIPLRGHTDPVNSVSFSPDATRIVTGSSFNGDGANPGEGDVTVALSNSVCPISISFISSHSCQGLHYPRLPVVSTVA